MKKIVLLASIMFFLISISHVYSSSYTCELKDYGIYSLKNKYSEKEEKSILGKKFKVKNIKLLKETDNIPLDKNINFGFRYIIKGPNNNINIKLVVLSPPLTGPDGKVITRGESSWKRQIGKLEYSGYGFDEDWEMVPGKWTFQLFYKNNMLLEKSFMLE